MTKAIDKIIDICTGYYKKALVALNNPDIDSLKQQYNLGIKHTAMDVRHDISRLEIKDECAEFLEELEQILIDDLIEYHNQDDDYNHGRNEAANIYMHLIKEFQAKQKEIAND